MQIHNKGEMPAKALEDRKHSENLYSKIIRPASGKRNIVFFVLLTVILSAMVWHIWSSFDQLGQLENQKDEMADLHGTIIYFDEVLTMSARMAAATGDSKWEDRYRSFEPQLDDAINRAIELTPKDFVDPAADQTDAANIKLVAMETESFDLVHQGNLQAANKLLYSQEYEKQKGLYKEGMEQYLISLHDHIANKHDMTQSTLLIFSVFLILIFTLSIFSGIAILHMRKNLIERKQKQIELEANEQQLKASNQQLQASEDQMKTLNHHLAERAKELDCLYKLSELAAETNKSVDAIFTEAVNLIPPSWQYPEVTCAKITVENKEYVTDNFKETKWKQSSDIMVSGRKNGFVEVYYSEEKPVIDEDPFLKEERSLIDALCRQLGNIIERKQAEQELENIAKFPSENPNPILRITKDGKVLYSNQAGELLLTKWKSGIGKTVPEKWQNIITKAFTSGKSIKEEEVVEDSIFSVTIAPIKEAGYVNLYASDITENKKSEEQLRKNEHQYKTLVENLPQRILLKDRDSVFVSCNEHYADEFDMTPNEMVGKTDYDFYKKRSADKYRVSDSEVLKSRARKDDYITVTEDNKEKIIHVVKTPVIDNESEDGDELVGVLCIFEDVTKQKQAERSTEKAYGELHEAHEELKSVQSQIIQNEKLASIGQLAAGVAHEINNPMGFVSSNFETLQSYVKKFQSLFDIYSKFVEEAKNEGGKKMLEKVEEIEELREDTQIDFVIEDIEGLFSDMQEGLGRITNIVQNLRDFSRIDQRGELAEYDLNDGIRSTLLVAKNEIKYDANVKTDFGEVPLFLCNPGQVNQVFLNMFMNAAQAIKSQEKKKKGNITVSTYVDDEDAICEITDDGPGIAPDKVSKIFDPFFTTKAPGKGTGLGLSVSHDIIVNKHNGVILVDSTVGEGTKFTIRLPVKCEITEETDEI